MAQKYRTKPAYVDVVRWYGNNVEEVLDFVGKRDQPGARAYHHATTGSVHIPGTDGGTWALRGDYIVREADGEFSACSAVLFAKTYEPVLESVAA